MPVTLVLARFSTGRMASSRTVSNAGDFDDAEDVIDTAGGEGSRMPKWWQADLSRRLSNTWKTPDQPETPATMALIISTVCILGVVPPQDTMDFGELKSPSKTSLSFPSIIIPDEVNIYEGIDRGKSPPLATISWSNFSMELFP